jgi:hypothetical protein
VVCQLSLRRRGGEGALFGRWFVTEEGKVLTGGAGEQVFPPARFCFSFPLRASLLYLRPRWTLAT